MIWNRDHIERVAADLARTTIFSTREVASAIDYMIKLELNKEEIRTVMHAAMHAAASGGFSLHATISALMKADLRSKQ